MLLQSGLKGEIDVRMILVGLAIAAVLSVLPTVAFQTEGGIVPAGSAAISVHRIAGDIAPGGS